MDITTFEHLCNLSKLNYSQEEQQKTIAQMSEIIALMDTIREFDVSYDDTKDKNEISFADLRKDETEPSFETQKLQQNTQSVNNCYIVPKMME